MKVSMYLETNMAGSFVFSPPKPPPTQWVVIDEGKVLFKSQSIADCESYLRLRQEELLGKPVLAPGYTSFLSQKGEGELVP